MVMMGLTTMTKTKTRIMTDPLPPYTVVVYKENVLWNKGLPSPSWRELVAVKRIGGHWDVIGGDYWFNSDAELFDHWSEVEIIGEGIWPNQQ